MGVLAAKALEMAASNPNQMEAAQAQVQEVVGVMRNNIDKVLERDSKLSDLDNRASTLEASSSMFQQSSRRLRKKFWWQNMKMKLWLGGCSLVILIALVLIVYFSVHEKSKVIPPLHLEADYLSILSFL